MIIEKSNIMTVLLDVKKENELDLDDQLIRNCYELQKKFQFDPNRNTQNLMRDLIENSLNREESQ